MKAAKYLQSRTKTESGQSLAALLLGLVGLQLQWSGEVFFPNVLQTNLFI